MLIALLIILPITNIITGILVFKAVQVGLRWNMQLKEGKEPTIHNPIKEHFQEKKAEVETKKEEAKLKSDFASYFGPADILSPIKEGDK